MSQQCSVPIENSFTKKTILTCVCLTFGAYILYHRIMKSSVTSLTDTDMKENLKKIKSISHTKSYDPTSGDCSTATQGCCNITSTANSNDIKRDRPVSEKQPAKISQHLNELSNKNIN